MSFPREFRVFDRHRRARSHALSAPLAVSIHRRGAISMSAAAYDAIGKPGAVELLYDRAEQIVGLRPVAPEVGHAYPVRAQGGQPGGPFIVAGRAFTKHFGIDTSVARRLPAIVEDGVLCVDLKASGHNVAGTVVPTR